MEVIPKDSKAAEADELLELLMADTQGVVKRGGATRLEEVFGQDDPDIGMPVAVKTYEDAGTVTVYDTQTREPSIISRNMLPAQLKKLNEKGQRMFTLQKPTEPPKRGTFKCWLHPDLRSEHPEYDEWGLPICMKSNIPSPFHVRQHVKAKHEAEWEAIGEYTKEQREQQERDRQERLLVAAAGGAQAITGREKKAS